MARGSTTYTQDLVAPLAQVLNDGTTNAIYGLARIRSGNSTWYQHDGLGSVRTILNGGGAVQSTTSYDPWGTPQTALADSFGFTGELQFGEQVHLRARWYHTNLGTFTARDPFAGFDTQPYSLHPYQYAYSAPTTWSDPSGKLAIFVSGRGSEKRTNYEFGNAAAGLISVWEMAHRFAPHIAGKTIIASWNAVNSIQQEVEVTSQCKDEPIILVGHSLGAGSIMQVAALSPDYNIDLLVTMDIVDPSQDALVWPKPKSVRRHINFMSEFSFQNISGKIISVREIVGAENVLVQGASHRKLDNEFLDPPANTKTNPVWSQIEQAIRTVMTEYL